MEKQSWRKAIWIYLAVYFAVSLLFLTRFPMMHSDEAWLSGLTRAMLQSGLGATEPFFDLLPSYPNAVSVVFNFIQMAFITLFGYGLFSVRIISLVFGTATLLQFYQLIHYLSGSVKKALWAAVILSLDVQFITASHLARQDIIITFGVVAVLFMIIRYAGEWSVKRDIVLGIVVGLMAGVHPNGLMVAACAGSLYLYHICKKQLRLKGLLIVVLIAAGFTGIYIGASFIMDKEFLHHYMAYGTTLGVGGSLAEKLRALPTYFLKLYLRISGTYYIPPIRFQLILFAGAAAASALFAVFRRETLRFLLPVIAVLAAVIFIGRYSQPAAAVFFPMGWLLVFVLLDRLPVKPTAIAAVLLGAALLVQSVSAVRPYLNNDYREYISRIEAVVPKDSRVLANLNSEYAYNCGMLLDYRNLAYLGDMSFRDYIVSNHISYIVYPEEMDYIYENRPIWNILYGNLFPYYEDMKNFINTSCTLVDEFTSPYAMRISGYAYLDSWNVRIYRVKGEA